MLDFRIAGMGMLASSSLLLTAPVMPDGCTSTDPGAGGAGGSAPAQVCGNGRREGSELCDGADLNRPSSDCTSWDSSGEFTGGTIGCTNQCIYDLSQCTRKCGDGVIEGWEKCEGDLFRADVSRRCTDHSDGFVGGTVACDDNCQLDYSPCVPLVPVCGDGKIEGEERCEGTIPDGLPKTCEEMTYPYPPLIPTTQPPFTGGPLECGANCQIDSSHCVLRGCYVLPRFGVQCY